MQALVDRIRKNEGRLDILVNDIWGGDDLMEWEEAFWETKIGGRPTLLDLAIKTHLITSHHAPAPDLESGGLLVEITDGDADYNGALTTFLLRPGEDDRDPDGFGRTPRSSPGGA